MPTLRERFTTSRMRIYPNLRAYIAEVMKEIRKGARTLTLWERFKTWFAPASFGVKDSQGEHFFVPADRLTVTKSGRLLFWRRGVVCAAVAEDKWERVLKGISLEDVEE